MRIFRPSPILALLLASCGAAPSQPRETSVQRQAPRGADASPAQSADDSHDSYSLAQGIRIPLRDGLSLSANIYRPRDRQRAPVVMMMTPYGASTHNAWGRYYASRGFVTAIVDVRGRGDSDGAFDPWKPRPEDGYDAIEWLAKQDYSTGKVGTFGGSYTGMLQWTTSRSAPPHLVSMAPFASVGLGLDFPMLNGAWDAYVARWLSYVSGRTNHKALFEDGDYWHDRAMAIATGRVAYRDADRDAVGHPLGDFARALEHPTFDTFWSSTFPTAEECAKLRVPVLTITGAYDSDQPGALEYYRRHTTAVSAGVAENHFLVVGPWDHAGSVSDPVASFDGVTFGPASVIDKKDLLRQWFEWTLNGGSKPAFLKDRVAAYVGVADEWRYAYSLAKLTEGQLSLRLGGKSGCGKSIAAPCSLERDRSADVFASSWVSDPMDSREAMALAKESETPLTDTRDLEALHGEALVFETAPFPSDVTILGRPRATLWLQPDVPDTDIRARIYEVDGAGHSLLLTSTTVRARLRNGLGRPTDVHIREPEAYGFDAFFYFGRRFVKGSRLRFVVGTYEGPGVPRNPQTGESLASAKGRVQRGNVRIVSDMRRPSTLELPIAPSK